MQHCALFSNIAVCGMVKKCENLAEEVGRWKAETTRYRDEPGGRVLDLRLEGVPFVEVLSRRECRVFSCGPLFHIHAGCVEIAYCVKGRLAFRTPGGELPFVPGDVFVSRDDEPHCLTSNPKGLFVYRILVRLPGAGRCMAGMTIEETRWICSALVSLPRRFQTSGKALRERFDRCFEIYDRREWPSVRRKAALRLSCQELLFAVLDAAESSVRQRILPGVAEWMRRMEADPAADYSLDAMSRSVGLSPNMFSRQFKCIAGLPPHAHLMACRVCKAEALLREGRMSIEAIAHTLRFASTQYFSTAFKSITGRTPSSFRGV